MIISRYNSDHNNPTSQQCYGTEENSYLLYRVKR